MELGEAGVGRGGPDNGAGVEAVSVRGVTGPWMQGRGVHFRTVLWTSFQRHFCVFPRAFLTATWIEELEWKQGD